MKSDLEALRSKAPAFTLKDDLNNMNDEVDNLRSAFMNLLDEHNRRKEEQDRNELRADDDDNDSEENKMKRRLSKYGPLDADYLKWTSCFKRKSVLWDD